MRFSPDFRKKALTTVPLTLAASVGLGVLSLLFAMKEHRAAFFSGYFANPLIALLNLLPCVLLAMLLFAVTGRAAPAFLLSGAVVMGFTWVGWFKLQFRSDPLLAEDLGLLREAGDMAGKYQMFLPVGLPVTVVCLALGTFVLSRCARWRPSARLRLGAAAVVIVLLLPLRAVYFSNTVYNPLTGTPAAAGRWDVTQVYQSKGFAYPFLHSFRKVGAAAPDGYRADASEKRLSAFPDVDIPEGKKVNIVAVMLESYCDFTGVPGVPALAEEVYAPYHALEQEGISGTLVTNIFAGGTVNSERGFLTGYPVLPSFRNPTESFVRYLAGQGYHTTGSHPGNRWFYQRDSVNANLGFQEYYFLEDHYGALADGGIAYDDVLFPELARLCATETEPYFSFTVTYQGHGPYPDNENIWSGESIDKSGCSESEAYILNNYFSSIANTSRNVAALADSLRDSSSPTVLLVFGDHKPWLGDNQAVYTSRGIPVGCGTDEGFLCHYSTQYLIWGNDAAKRVLGRSLRGEGSTVAPSMLMCALFDALGWEGPALMQEQRALIDAGVTMYHSVAENVLYRGSLRAPDELPEPARTLLQEYLCDAYYVQRNVPA